MKKWIVCAGGLIQCADCRLNTAFGLFARICVADIIEHILLPVMRHRKKAVHCTRVLRHAHHKPNRKLFRHSIVSLQRNRPFHCPQYAQTDGILYMPVLY